MFLFYLFSFVHFCGNCSDGKLFSPAIGFSIASLARRIVRAGHDVPLFAQTIRTAGLNIEAKWAFQILWRKAAAIIGVAETEKLCLSEVNFLSS